MTREEQKAYNAENYPASVLSWMNEATDRAFDELKSRTCENCKHLGIRLFPGKYKEDHWICNEQIGYDTCSDSNEPYVIPTFGCNEFIRKLKDES